MPIEELSRVSSSKYAEKQKTERRKRSIYEPPKGMSLVLLEAGSIVKIGDRILFETVGSRWKKALALDPKRIVAIWSDGEKNYILYETDKLDFYEHFTAKGLPSNAKMRTRITTTTWDLSHLSKKEKERFLEEIKVPLNCIPESACYDEYWEILDRYGVKEKEVVVWEPKIKNANEIDWSKVVVGKTIDYDSEAQKIAKSRKLLFKYEEARGDIRFIDKPAGLERVDIALTIGREKQEKIKENIVVSYGLVVPSISGYDDWGVKRPEFLVVVEILDPRDPNKVVEAKIYSFEPTKDDIQKALRSVLKKKNISIGIVSAVLDEAFDTLGIKETLQLFEETAKKNPELVYEIYKRYKENVREGVGHLYNSYGGTLEVEKEEIVVKAIESSMMDIIKSFAEAEKREKQAKVEKLSADALKIIAKWKNNEGYLDELGLADIIFKLSSNELKGFAEQALSKIREKVREIALKRAEEVRPMNLFMGIDWASGILIKKIKTKKGTIIYKIVPVKTSKNNKFFYGRNWKNIVITNNSITGRILGAILNSISSGEAVLTRNGKAIPVSSARDFKNYKFLETKDKEADATEYANAVFEEATGITPPNISTSHSALGFFDPEERVRITKKILRKMGFEI